MAAGGLREKVTFDHYVLHHVLTSIIPRLCYSIYFHFFAVMIMGGITGTIGFDGYQFAIYSMYPFVEKNYPVRDTAWGLFQDHFV